MKISVVIPSYRRSADLKRCLNALGAQAMPPYEIIIVARPEDAETWEVIDQFATQLPIIAARVTEPGVIQAENIGIALAQGNIIAFTDDDAAPHSDWINRIANRFSDNAMNFVGVGGRDIIYQDGRPIVGCHPVVGKLSWFGRMKGNHHLGCGEARYVDILKGVNMAFRAEVIKPIGLDVRLRGEGAQMHWELMLCLTARKSGFQLLYDPDIKVDHYPGKRFGRDCRTVFYSETMTENVHNETLAILSYFGAVRRCVFVLWSTVIGYRGAPGLIQLVRLWLLRLPAVAMFLAAQKGRVTGWKAWLTQPR